MASLNKVILIGNLGTDPELRSTGSGIQITNFNIATTEKWQGGEKTEWHRIVAFGKQAETCKQYLSKGRQIYVEGRIQTRQWNDKEGNKRYTTEVVANRILFLGSSPGRSAGASAGAGTGTNVETSVEAGFTPADTSPGFPVDDEIPF